MTTEKVKELPDKLSDLLDLAVTDAIAVSENPNRILDMNVWHSPKGKKCAMCMGGAVMERQLGVGPHEDMVPARFGDKNVATKLRWINSMREGYFGANSDDDLNSDKSDDPVLIKCRELVQNNYDRKIDRAPWRVYRRAAELLREAGL